MLRLLHGEARADVARFAVGIADDPSPVYAALWGQQPTVDDVLALGRCLRERTSSAPLWTLRIAGALALLAQRGNPTQQATAAAQLRTVTPQIKHTLIVMAQSGERVQHAIERLFARLPLDIATECATSLMLHADMPMGFAWALADQLATTTGASENMPVPPVDEHVFARWAYVLALNSAESRARLAGAVDELLDVLRHAGAGDERVSRVAAALDNEHEPADVFSTELTKDHESSDVPPIASAQQPAVHSTEDVPATLARSARDISLPLYERLLSVAGLSKQVSSEELLALLEDQSVDVDVRAAAARTLGKKRDQMALAAMIAQLRDPHSPPDLLESVCEALGWFGDAAAVAPLLELLERIADDPILTIAAIKALGAIGAPAAVPLLGTLLGIGAWERLHAAVNMIDPQQHSTILLNNDALPARLAVQLAAALNSVSTDADRPTTLAEFLAHEADHIRTTAAQVLAQIGGDEARAALQTALTEDVTGGAIGIILRALAQLDPPDNPATLGELISNPNIAIMTRWQAIQHLHEHPGGSDVMRHGLAQEDLDPFIRGALAEALGHVGATAALPLLQQLATTMSGDAHLRSQAIVALGLLDDPTSESALIQIIRSTTEDDTLRGMAAEHLPSQLSDDSRHFLRDLLRREQPPVALIIGALHALGRAHDRESMSLLLRYCQDSQPAVAQAALAALHDMADSSVDPVLMQMSQDPAVDAATRLQALGTLLRLGGDSYRALLRSALEHGPLSLRLQALEYLLDAGTPTTELLGVLAGVEWPLPLRLRLLERSDFTPATYPVLIGIVENRDDYVQLRWRVVTMLAQAEHPAVIRALTRRALDSSELLPLRLHCVTMLDTLGGPDEGVALSELAASTIQSPVLRRGAAQTVTMIAARAI